MRLSAHVTILAKVAKPWKDKDGKEYFVPLEGLDKSEAKNPNGAFSYNSETKELIFSAIVASDSEYILRSYKY